MSDEDSDLAPGTEVASSAGVIGKRSKAAGKAIGLVNLELETQEAPPLCHLCQFAVET